MKLRIKANQGIVNNCDHVQTRQEGYKENHELSSKLINVCEMCLKHLNAIVVENDYKSTTPLPLSSQSSKNNQQLPPVSINVVDADNFNVCMCNVTDDKERGSTRQANASSNENICPSCRHLIKQPSMERRTLVAKQTMLGDVIVNRIDSQYLSSTYSSSPSQMRLLKDPYTPESVESHSPIPEIDDSKEFPSYINSTTDDEEIFENMREVIKNNGAMESVVIDESDKIGGLLNHYNLNHTVSPSQLQTRLEILRRESQLECTSKTSGSGSSEMNEKKSSLHSKCCLCCSCAIL